METYIIKHRQNETKLRLNTHSIRSKRMIDGREIEERRSKVGLRHRMMKCSLLAAVHGIHVHHPDHRKKDIKAGNVW